MTEIKTAGGFERAAKDAERRGDLNLAHDLYCKAAQLALGEGRKKRNEAAAKRIEEYVKRTGIINGGSRG